MFNQENNIKQESSERIAISLLAIFRILPVVQQFVGCASAVASGREDCNRLYEFFNHNKAHEVENSFSQFRSNEGFNSINTKSKTSNYLEIKNISFSYNKTKEQIKILVLNLRRRR